MKLSENKLFSKHENMVMFLYGVGAALGLVQALIVELNIADMFDSVSEMDFILKLMFWILCFPVMVFGKLLSTAVLVADVFMLVMAVAARLCYKPSGQSFRVYRMINFAAEISFCSIMSVSLLIIVFVVLSVFMMAFMHKLYIAAMLVILLCMAAVYRMIRKTIRLMANEYTAEETVQNCSEEI